MSREIVLLVAGAGGAGPIEIIQTLKRTQMYRVVAVDASPFAAGLALADRGYVVPPAVDAAIEESLRLILAEERPDFIVPLVDEEIPIVHRLASTVSEPKPLVVAPSPSFCLSTLDKWGTYRMLSEAGIPLPPTCLASSVEDCTFPAVI
ncbi:MAG: hypothetical protein M1358_04340 [Chloroflexi bacterium]|nr:hypothetical protein [Chloroflexota bacterium]